MALHCGNEAFSVLDREQYYDLANKWVLGVDQSNMLFNSNL